MSLRLLQFSIIYWILVSAVLSVITKYEAVSVFCYVVIATQMVFFLYLRNTHRNIKTTFTIKGAIDYIFIITSLLLVNIWTNIDIAIFTVCCISILGIYTTPPKQSLKFFTEFTSIFLLISCVICTVLNINMFILYTGFFVFTSVFMYTIRRRQSKELSAEKSRIRYEIKKLESSKQLYGVVNHKLSNINMLILNRLQSGMPVDSDTAHRIVNEIQSVLNSAFDINTSKIKIGSLIQEYVDNKLINKVCHIHDELYGITIEARYSPLIYAIDVFLMNSIEASATKINIMHHNNCITISDNGGGFDTSKISEGYTTKPTGHGYGLVRVIDHLMSEGYGVKVESQIGTGTVITIDLSNHLI